MQPKMSLLLRRAVASGGVVAAFLTIRLVLKCSHEREPFHIFWRVNRRRALKILNRQMACCGVGLGQSQPQLSLEVLSLLQLEFGTPSSSPDAGMWPSLPCGHARSNSKCL